MTDPAAPSSPITLDYAPPPEDLRPYLSVFYEFRSSLPRFEDVDKADLAQFRVMLSGKGEYGFADGSTQRAPVIQIVGPTTGPTRLRVEGPVHVFGVGLLPAGWGALLDFEASLLVNRVIDGAELFGEAVMGLTEALRHSRTIDEKVAVASSFARRIIGRGRSPAFDFTRIVDTWLESSPAPQVDDLVAMTGLSRRQVERRCNTYYGSPPKLLARKYRALKATIAMARGEAEGIDPDAFYDQSHFIREIKAFTGVTPKTIAGDLPTLATLTLKRSELTGLAPLITKS